MKLAPKFKYVKFVKIKSTQAVENWPESRCPTLFLYNEGKECMNFIYFNKISLKCLLFYFM
jgi:hypothetical protein